LDALENLARQPEEVALLMKTKTSGAEGQLTKENAEALADWVKLLVARANNTVSELASAKDELERALPEKLTAVVEKAEAARRLQTNLQSQRAAKLELDKVTSELERIARVRTFLVSANSAFAKAESSAGARRLAAIEPATRAMFASIMFSDVVPALKKRVGSEELSILLAEFWSLSDISAQAVLSESYRNAFAISVYLAAASLYGGDAKFLGSSDESVGGFEP